jgi:ubiquinone/menaquinone biosynthesis C-methylase UbiE
MSQQDQAAEREESIRSYYDEFAARYEDQRRTRRPDGYHALIDDLEIDFALRYGAGGDLLEVGCGTGLILERLAAHCKTAKGVDLSPGMLEPAKARGLDVQVGSATSLPFEDEQFDVVCSFKVLAHVPEIEQAIREMLRVTRKGGYVLAELYNPMSLRALVKRLGPAGAISDKTKESAVFTRGPHRHSHRHDHARSGPQERLATRGVGAVRQPPVRLRRLLDRGHSQGRLTART